VRRTGTGTDEIGLRGEGWERRFGGLRVEDWGVRKKVWRVEGMKGWRIENVRTPSPLRGTPILRKNWWGKPHLHFNLATETLKHKDDTTI
jgi:hypothetical protein